MRNLFSKLSVPVRNSNSPFAIPVRHIPSKLETIGNSFGVISGAFIVVSTGIGAVLAIENLKKHRAANRAKRPTADVESDES